MRWSLPLSLLLLAACSSSAPVEVRRAALQAPSLSGLPEASREAVAQARIPVLLLPERFAAESVVTVGPRWYAVSFHRDRDVTVSIHATDMVHGALSDEERAALPPPEHQVRGVPARTGVNEGIRYVTFTEDGVAYALEVECWDVRSDPRCTAPYWALDLADELVEVRR